MLPKIDIKACQPERRSDGAVLLTLGRNTRSISKSSEFDAIVAIGRDGSIFWHRQCDFGLMDCRLSAKNTLLVMGTSGQAIELSFDGKERNRWYCRERFPENTPGKPLDTMKLHHTICELSDGLIASLSIEHCALDKPDGDWTHYMSDTIVVFDRQGRIAKEISIGALLDPQRRNYGALAPYWANQGWPCTLDLTHANCLIEDKLNGGFLISLRHQDAIIKVTPEGELVWILGDPNGWTGKWRDKLLTIKGGRPFYHQHDLSFTRSGDLMLFDNGTGGAAPPDPEQSIEERESFALSYKIDETAGTATEIWRYGGKDLPYSHYVSGVCEMPNGNRFIACTGLVHDLNGKRVEIPPTGVGSIELFEVTPDGERVFHATIAEPDANPNNGWNGFRPEFIDPRIAASLT